ncbi:MAG: 1-(5-phosphoribosyl)-5-[(5-phosphoribosylamino)methylideneamino]imidazole-4-carboxamide isomerase [Melioribacteraceae bacterium]|nr:1-(5-phosphoribosyl)-5-[(5-phosphoribosylamino)methylideneamino]imidazole-4-carboxamide isomerase [Melioribacteraceae bacterium]
MIVLPAIDILENKVVRLEKGNYNNVTVYNNSAIDQAVKYDTHGFKWLHIVDLLGSKNGEINIIESIKEIKKNTNLKIEFGGGVRNLENAEKLISIGVDKIIVGSLSIKEPELFSKMVTEFGADKFIVAADINNENVFVKGWTEDSGRSISEHIEFCSSLDLETYLVTDIAKDGMLQGPSFNLYKDLQLKFPNKNFIVSGGISNIADVKKANEENYYGVIVGKAIYENRINLEELIKIGK